MIGLLQRVARASVTVTAGRAAVASCCCPGPMTVLLSDPLVGVRVGSASGQPPPKTV